MDVVQAIANWSGWPVVVAVILLAVAYAGWLLKNRIDHLKEINESLQQRITLPGADQVAPDAYGIRVLYPTNDVRVDHSFDVTGTFKKTPRGFEIWTFVIKDYGRDVQYWPQERATIRDNAWYSRVYYAQSGTQKIAGFLVGENGQALIHYFKKAGTENSSPDVPRWPAITELTSDTVLCVSFQVSVV